MWNFSVTEKKVSPVEGLRAANPSRKPLNETTLSTFGLSPTPLVRRTGSVFQTTAGSGAGSPTGKNRHYDPSLRES